MRFVVRNLAVVAGLTGLMACGSDSGTGVDGDGNGGNNNVTVDVVDNSFSPSSQTIEVGATVTWTWEGNNPHNVTFDDGGPASQTQTSGTYQRTFGSSGTFTYFCTVHGRAVMSGTVTVNTGGSSSGTGGGGGGDNPSGY